MSILETKDLRKIYGAGDTAVRALDGVNLSVENGEFVTIVGTSGSGKSTLLHMLGGLDRPSSGSVMVDGKNIFELKDEALTIFRRRKIGFVFQSYNLVPVLNVYENIVLPIQLDGRRADENFIQQIVKTLGLDGRLDALPNQLSGGQQQRVAIARSVVMEPGLLLLDEPLSNLDTKLRTEMRYELKQIHNRLKRASVYVTHDQSEALALSDKIVIMKLGKVQQIGTPKQVFLYPANRFVADFMGYKNIWDAKILSIEESGNIRKFQVESYGLPFTVHSLKGENEEVEKTLIQAYQKGEEVLLASRPDDILAETAGENDMRIKVEGTEYLGTTIQVTGSIKEGMDVQARIEPNTLVKEGATLSLTIQPDKLLVLPKDKEE